MASAKVHEIYCAPKEVLEVNPVPSAFRGDDGYLKAPLLFDPGTRWEYGISTEWLGKLIEKVSGQTLEEYFRLHIFEPLGMTDNIFRCSLRETSACRCATSARGGWRRCGARATALQTGAIF